MVVGIAEAEVVGRAAMLAATDAAASMRAWALMQALPAARIAVSKLVTVEATMLKALTAARAAANKAALVKIESIKVTLPKVAMAKLVPSLIGGLLTRPWGEPARLDLATPVSLEDWADQFLLVPKQSRGRDSVRLRERRVAHDFVEHIRGAAARHGRLLRSLPSP